MRFCLHLPTMVILPKPSRRLASTSISALEALATAAFQEDRSALRGTSKEVVTATAVGASKASDSEAEVSEARPLPLPLPLPFETLDTSEAQDLKPPAHSELLMLGERLRARRLQRSTLSRCDFGGG